MPSRHDSADSLADIVENAERVEGYMAGVDRVAFAGIGLLRDAVKRVYEAAHRLGGLAAALIPIWDIDGSASCYIPTLCLWP